MASSRICAAIAAATLLGITGAHADLVISNGATHGIFCDLSGCSDYGSSGGVFNVGDLKKMLREQGALIVYAAPNTRLRVEAPLTWAQSAKLTLAGFIVVVNAPVTVKGKATLDMQVNSDDLVFGRNGRIDFLDMESKLSIGFSPYKLVNSLAALAAGIKANPGTNYALANDYDAGPDGVYAQAPIPDPLSGKFNGLGHVVSNLRIAQNEGAAPVGLFSRLASGTVEALGVVHADIVSQGASCAGVLVGDNGGAIDHVFATGSISTTGARRTGGLVGCQTGYLQHAWTSTEVTGNVAGGLVGLVRDGTIRNSYAVGAVHTLDGPGSPIGGGLAGEVRGFVELTHVYSAGAVTGPGTLGGFMGLKSGTEWSIQGIYWNTTTSGLGAGCGHGACKAVGLTTEELRSGLPDGFADYYWTERPHRNGGMPYLVENPPR